MAPDTPRAGDAHDLLLADIAAERAAIARLESLLRQDPAGFDQMERLVGHCHRYRNLNTILALRDSLLAT